MNQSPDITALLQGLAVQKGTAFDTLFPVVYDELRKLAQCQLRGERPNHTLQPTALANEAYLKLARLEKIAWQDRRHFFAAAGQAMRRILVDHARGLRRRKRAGRRVFPSLDAFPAIEQEDLADFMSFDEALQKLSADAPRKARVVELRFFSGLCAEEVADMLGVTVRTVERDWRYARAWLFRELNQDPGHEI